MYSYLCALALPRLRLVFIIRDESNKVIRDRALAHFYKAPGEVLDQAKSQQRQLALIYSPLRGHLHLSCRDCDITFSLGLLVTVIR